MVFGGAGEVPVAATAEGGGGGTDAQKHEAMVRAVQQALSEGAEPLVSAAETPENCGDQVRPASFEKRI